MWKGLSGDPIGQQSRRCGRSRARPTPAQPRNNSLAPEGASCLPGLSPGLPPARMPCGEVETKPGQRSASYGSRSPGLASRRSPQPAVSNSNIGQDVDEQTGQRSDRLASSTDARYSRKARPPGRNDYAGDVRTALRSLTASRSTLAYARFRSAGSRSLHCARRRCGPRFRSATTSTATPRRRDPRRRIEGRVDHCRPR